MKKYIVSVILIFLIGTAVTGCRLGNVNITQEETTGYVDYTYIYEPATVYVPPTTQETTAEETTFPETTVEPTTAAPATAEPTTVFVPVTEESAVPETTQPSTVAETTEEATETPSSVSDGEVDLSISLPEANGTMVVSADPKNEYIKTVNEVRGINVDLLAAVYSVPQSGQNYVFEFYSADGRGVDDLRRVYLINASGKITGVAAAASSERENISTTENWFNMNVLIKSLIFPKIAEQLADG